MRLKAGPPTPCTHYYTNCCAPQARKKPAEAKRPAGVMKSDYAEAASNATRQGERRRPASATSARETDARRRRWRGVTRQTVTGANTGGDRRTRRSRRRYCTPYPADHRAKKNPACAGINELFQLTRRIGGRRDAEALRCGISTLYYRVGLMSKSAIRKRAAAAKAKSGYRI